MYKTLIALTLGLLSSQAMAEQMYRWADDQGIAQFGQQPPEGRSYQRVDITSAPPPGGAVRAPEPLPAASPQAAREQQKQQADHQSVANKAAQAKRLEQCGQLQTNLRTLETNPRLSRTNEAGELERIGEDERQGLIEKTKAELDSYCNN